MPRLNGQAEDGGAARAGHRGGLVGRAVVDDDDIGPGDLPAQPVEDLRKGGRLVEGGDDDEGADGASRDSANRGDRTCGRPPPLRCLAVRAGRTSSAARDVLCLLLIAAAFALPLRGLLRYQGPPMEEGFMLAFPQRVLAGDVPNTDFLHLYGPGSLWALAGVFEVFGDTLATERLFGLLQHAGIVFGIFAIARPWGRRLATACALVALVVIIGPIGLTALAWNGAVALGVCGLGPRPGRAPAGRGRGDPVRRSAAARRRPAGRPGPALPAGPRGGGVAGLRRHGVGARP